MTTHGKRRMPAFFQLTKGQVVEATLDSHEQDGRAPVLLSNQSQAELGMIKDMRLKQVYLKILEITWRYAELMTQD